MRAMRAFAALNTHPWEARKNLVSMSLIYAVMRTYLRVNIDHAKFLKTEYTALCFGDHCLSRVITQL